MEKQSLPKLTPSEFELMNIIWESGKTTVTEVLNAYNAKVPGEKQVTRSTIQAQIARLTDKGWLQYEHLKNTFYYSATQKRAKVKRDIVHDINKRIFGGSCAKLVTALFDNNEISKDEITKLRELINQRGKML